MKIVMILNSDLGPGLAANTAAVLGISLGHANPAVIGPALYDKSNTCHPGITRENIPVLSSDAQTLKALFKKGNEVEGLSIISFNTIAHKSRDYDTYAQNLSSAQTHDLEFSGLCIKGPKKAVNLLTGNMTLYG